MKNFYEATVTKPNLKLGVELVLTPIGNVPCLVKLNNKTYFENTLIGKTIVKCEVGLTDPINLSIQIYRNHPDAVELKLNIDGYEVLPKYQHLATPPTDYLDFNGVWTLNIPNFYPWYHEITGQGWIA